MSTGDWQKQEEPEIGARHLLLCRDVAFDPAFPDSPYTARGFLSVFRLSGDVPAVWHDPVYLYVEFFGDPGVYEIWFDLVRFVFDESGDIADEIDEGCYGPFDLRLPPAMFIQGRSYPLKKLPLTGPGVYEFQLRVAGKSEVLLSTRFLVEVTS